MFASGVKVAALGELPALPDLRMRFLGFAASGAVDAAAAGLAELDAFLGIQIGSKDRCLE